MNKLKTLVIAFALLVVNAHTAVDPKYQNAKDLDVMLKFVKSHEVVIGTLKSINMQNFTVLYKEKNTSCIASFTRQIILFVVGDLTFQSSTCKLKEQ